MKKFWLIGLVVLAMFMIGCAGMLGETGIKKSTSLSLSPIQSKAIYYKPVLYNAGLTRWNFVGSTPETQPNESLLEFKDILLQEVKTLFKERGCSLIEVEKQTSDSSIYIEMRISFLKFFPSSVGATRWYVFYPRVTEPIEIYYWQFGSEGAAKSIAEKAVRDVLELLEPPKETAGKLE